MQKILKGSDIKNLDASHVSTSNQSSWDLMESASTAFVNWFLARNYSKEQPIHIACGAGNNGGDGLAVARLLVNRGFEISVIQCFSSIDSLSADAKANWDKLPEAVSVYNWNEEFPPADLLIDAFLGVGLKGELRPEASLIVEKLNQTYAYIISIDIPSGLPSDEVTAWDAVKAAVTVTFEFPKLALLLPEHAEFVGELVVLPIGLAKKEYERFDSDRYFLQAKDILPLHKSFGKFSHKGVLGKVLMVGGSPGKMGALILSTRAALRTGSGLVSSHMDESEHLVVQAAVPEAMASWGVIADPTYYHAIGIGPGWGQDNRHRTMKQLLEDFQRPVVLDADALNLLARHREFLEFVPPNSILTPHIGEFTRLTGPSEDHIERLAKAKEFAMTHQVILVLKGAHTCISLPDGRQVFNSSGTRYMATGGSGDVLTGMITSFLGQGYSSENAALCGVYHHGLAGEIASRSKGRSLIAGDIVEAIPATYLEMGIH